MASGFNIKFNMVPVINGAEINSQATQMGAAFGKSFQQAFNKNRPLGNITGNISEFQKSMEAANARVIAFGASAGSIYLVKEALDKIVSSTINVQKSLTGINIILGLGNTALKSFSNEMFKAASQTGQTFETASKVALEFARHGVSASETSKRMTAAMQLMRISGLSAGDSVNVLTAAINAFSKEGLTASDIVGRLTAVDTKFAISAQDLAKAIQRVGSTAEDAGVHFNQLLGLVTAAQTATARGGAVIGNAFKSIFTRLSRPQVLDDLQAIGVQVKNANNQILPMITILKNLAGSYNTLNAAQKSFITEAVGGVYQVNILKASLADLGNGVSIFDKASIAASQSAGMIDDRMSQLNETIDSKLNTSVLSLTKLFSNFGQIAFAEKARGGIQSFNEQIQNLGKSLEDIQPGDSFAEKFKKTLGSGISQGLGSLISGPGVQIAMVLIIKSLSTLLGFVRGIAGDFLGMNDSLHKEEALLGSIGNFLATNAKLVEQRVAGQITDNQLMSEYVRQVQAAARAHEIIANTTGMIYKGIGSHASVTHNTSSSGYIPSFSDDDSERAGAERHGYRSGAPYKKMVFDGRGGAFMTTVNQAESVTDFTNSAGYRATMVKPPNGFGPDTMRASSGFVPNFATQTLWRGVTGTRIAKLEAVQGDLSEETLKSIIFANKPESTRLQRLMGETFKDDSFDMTNLYQLLDEHQTYGLDGLLSTSKDINAAGRFATGFKEETLGSIDFPSSRIFTPEKFQRLYQKVGPSKLKQLIKNRKKPIGFDINEFLGDDRGYSEEEEVSLYSRGFIPHFAPDYALIAPGSSLTMKKLARARTFSQLKEARYLYEKDAPLALQAMGIQSPIHLSQEKNKHGQYNELLSSWPVKYQGWDTKGHSARADFFGVYKNHPTLIDTKSGFGDFKLSAMNEKIESMKILAQALKNDPALAESLYQSVPGLRDIGLSNMKYGIAFPTMPPYERTAIDWMREGTHIKNLGPPGNIIAQRIQDKINSGFLGSQLTGSYEAIQREMSASGFIPNFGEKEDVFARYRNSIQNLHAFHLNIEAELVKHGATPEQAQAFKRGIFRNWRHGQEEPPVSQYLLNALTTSTGPRGLELLNRFKNEQRLNNQLYGQTLNVKGVDFSLVEQRMEELRNQKKITASGFVPALNDAISREMSAGYSSSQVRVGRDGSLVSSNNPSGYGVYNSDEGSLSSGISLARAAGINPKTKGMASGFVPNFDVEGTFALGMLQASMMNLNNKINLVSIGYDKEISQKQKLYTEFDKLIEKTRILPGEERESSQRMISQTYERKLGYDPNDLQKRESHQIIYADYEKRLNQTRESFTKRAIGGMMISPMAGGIISSTLQTANMPDQAKAISTFTEGITEASQALFAMPNAVGITIAAFITLSKIGDTIGQWQSKLGESEKALDAQKTLLEKSSGALSSLQGSYDSLNSLFNTGTSDLESFLNISKHVAESMTQLAAINPELARKMSQAKTTEERQRVGSQFMDEQGLKTQQADFAVAFDKMVNNQKSLGFIDTYKNLKRGEFTSSGGQGDTDYKNTMLIHAATLVNSEILQKFQNGNQTQKNVIKNLAQGKGTEEDVHAVIGSIGLSSTFAKQEEGEKEAIKSKLIEILTSSTILKSELDAYNKNIDKLGALQSHEIALKQQYNQEIQNLLSKGTIISSFYNKGYEGNIRQSQAEVGLKYGQQEGQLKLESLFTDQGSMILKRGALEQKKIAEELPINQQAKLASGAANIGTKIGDIIGTIFKAPGKLPVGEETLNPNTENESRFLTERQKVFSGENSLGLIGLLKKGPQEFAKGFLGEKNKNNEPFYDTLFTKFSTFASNEGQQELITTQMDIAKVTEESNNEAIRQRNDMIVAFKENNFKELAQSLSGLKLLTTKGQERELKRRIAHDENVLAHSTNVKSRGMAAADLLEAMSPNERNRNNPLIQGMFNEVIKAKKEQNERVMGKSPILSKSAMNEGIMSGLIKTHSFQTFEDEQYFRNQLTSGIPENQLLKGKSPQFKQVFKTAKKDATQLVAQTQVYGNIPSYNSQDTTGETPSKLGAAMGMEIPKMDVGPFDIAIDNICADLDIFGAKLEDFGNKLGTIKIQEEGVNKDIEEAKKQAAESKTMSDVNARTHRDLNLQSIGPIIQHAETEAVTGLSAGLATSIIARKASEKFKGRFTANDNFDTEAKWNQYKKNSSYHRSFDPYRPSENLGDRIRTSTGTRPPMQGPNIPGEGPVSTTNRGFVRNTPPLEFQGPNTYPHEEWKPPKLFKKPVYRDASGRFAKPPTPEGSYTLRSADGSEVHFPISSQIPPVKPPVGPLEEGVQAGQIAARKIRRPLSNAATQSLKEIASGTRGGTQAEIQAARDAMDRLKIPAEEARTSALTAVEQAAKEAGSAAKGSSTAGMASKFANLTKFISRILNNPLVRTAGKIAGPVGDFGPSVGVISTAVGSIIGQENKGHRMDALIDSQTGPLEDFTNERIYKKNANRGGDFINTFAHPVVAVKAHMLENDILRQQESYGGLNFAQHMEYLQQRSKAAGVRSVSSFKGDRQSFNEYIDTINAKPATQASPTAQTQPEKQTVDVKVQDGILNIVLDLSKASQQIQEMVSVAVSDSLAGNVKPSKIRQLA